MSKREQQSSARSLADLQRIERRRGYKFGWALAVWRARQQGQTK